MIRRRKPIRRKKRLKPRSTSRPAELICEGDKYWKQIILKRDNWTCRGHILIARRYEESPLEESLWRVCGAKHYVQAHHVIKKSQSRTTRHLLENGVALCRGCHYWAHRHLKATETVRWYAQMGIDYEALLARSRISSKGTDWAVVVLWLKAEWAARQ